LPTEVIGIWRSEQQKRRDTKKFHHEGREEHEEFVGRVSNPPYFVIFGVK
jgi:hypothetical protein